jgi:predicted nucleic acid-binding protein
MAYAVVLDACVLFPSTLRDTLLTLAQRRLFQPLWSERILDEMRRNILAKRPHVVPARLDRTLQLMRATFDGACVEGFEPLEAGLELPDPDDRHVLAAAIISGAQAIVTKNLKDFPAKTLGGFDIEAVHPDDFLLDQLDLAPPAVVGGLRDQVNRFKNPPMDLIGLLARLERDEVPRFAEEVRRRTAL